MTNPKQKKVLLIHLAGMDVKEVYIRPTTHYSFRQLLWIHNSHISEEADIYEKAMRTLEFSFHYSSSVTNSDTWAKEMAETADQFSSWYD